MLPKFKVLLPKTLEEALQMKAEYGSDVCVYAGGTDILIRMKRGVLSPKYVMYLGGVDGLSYVGFDSSSGLRIGAMATLTEIAENKEVRSLYPALFNAVNLMATGQVRNKATLVGNICNAAPSADTAPPLIAYGADVVIRSLKGERVVSAEEFFTGPGATVLSPDELVTEIRVPIQEEGSFTSYVKFSHRSMVDIAVVGVASKVVRDNGTCGDVKIVLGAVAPTPMRAKKAEEFVKGKVLDEGVAEEAGAIASQEARPITDVRATEEYRRHLVGVLTKRALLFSFDKAGK